MMNKAEYWLLETVVEGWCPLDWLMAENIERIIVTTQPLDEAAKLRI